jgi:hypothetical protein
VTLPRLRLPRLPRLPRLRRLGLLGRVALALAAVGLLPLVILSAGLVGVNREAMLEQVQRTHAVAAQTAAAQTTAFLEARVALGRGLAASPALAGEPAGEAVRTALRDSLAAWADLGVLAIARLDARGGEVVRAQLRGSGEEVEAAVEERGRGIAMVGGGPGRPPLVRLDVALPPPDGGVLRIVCAGGELGELLRPVEIGEQAEMILIDRAGRRVAGLTPPSSFPPAVVAAALSGRASGAVRFRGADGVEVVGAYAPVPGAGWAVLSRQPAAVAEALARRVRNRSVLAIGAALILILGLSGAAWAGLVRPLRELVRAQRQLVRRDDAAPSGDEIADLRESLRTLERSLADGAAVARVLLGRYQVVEVLGAGAMGTVFRGYDPKLQRSVALKTVRLGDDIEPDRKRRLLETLLHEAVTLASVNHPNVVQIYDVQDAPEAAVVAMELVDGPSLERLLHGRGQLSAAEVIPLGAAIARGLDAAHRRGIVHRDVKPANVLLGPDGAVKVTDFGIADLQAAAAAARDTIFGTPGYLAPECLQGEGVTRASDLFSFGVVLYTCLSGTQPFVGRSVEDLVRATLFSPLRPLARQVPDLSPELASLVTCLLERDPARRPADAAAVAAELERMAAAGGLRWFLREGARDDRGAETAAFTFAPQAIPTSRLRATHRRPADSPERPAGD